MFHSPHRRVSNVVANQLGQNGCRTEYCAIENKKEKDSI